MNRMKRPTGGARRSNGGFALITVLLALVALTAMATAGFLRSRTDYRVNQNHRASLNAFYTADAGRAQYMGRGKLDDDTVAYSYASGNVRVWADTLIAVDDSSTLYRVTAEGTHQAPDGGLGRRRVSSVVIHKAAGFSVNAAITAPAGLNKNGAAGTVDGNDQATPSDCPVGGSENVAGLEVPPGLFNQNGGGGGGGKGKGGGGGGPSGFFGNPGIDSTKTAAQMISDLGINWQGMLNGSYAQADYIVSQHGYPNFGSQVASDEWPLILIDQASYSMSPTESGRGTIVAQGDLAFNGSVNWDGLVLVGGELTSNGVQHIHGAVVTGLNIQLGQTPNATNLGNGTWDYQYNACHVLNALKGIGWPVEEPGTWSEEM